ncbi:MAG: hypothetical protein LBF54_03400 [Holosporaceae bacterium]|nr:hypothetical protein [Holosporaceae bacterium]
MIQNVSSSNKVTKRHIIDISYTAAMPLGVNNMVTALFCIQGTGTNIAKIMWVAYQCGFNPPQSRSFAILTSGASLASYGWINGWSKFSTNLKVGVEYPSNQIYEELKINSGETKMACYTALYTGGNAVSTSALKMFLVLDIKADFTGFTGGQKQSIFFPATVIFTPKPGLFSETPPQ